MATRSTVGYELPDGSYRATYVHYDGYPRHMRQLLDMTREDVELMVTGGWLRGGIRSINRGVPEYFDDGWSSSQIHKPWPHRREEFAYMLRLDGTWVYLTPSGEEDILTNASEW